MTTEPTFEENMKQLEHLVGKLERGEASLEESLAAFEAGMKLVEVCKGQLALAEVKVEKVMEAHRGGFAAGARGEGHGDT